MVRPLLIAAAALCSTSAIAQDAVLEMGRERNAAFLSGELEPIWDDMTVEMQDGLGSLEDFVTFRQQVVDDFGEEDEVIDEQALEDAGFQVYTRTARFTGSDAPIETQWAFDSEGLIAGFYVQAQQQAALSDYSDYQTSADLRLPFEGEWFVFWGGRTIEDNYHASNPAQRFAYDFVVQEDGQSYSGEGEVLEDYYCWGREILAPADGQVVGVVNDLPDQPIGETDPDNPAGNHVILALGQEEFAFLAHMQAASVTVQNGQEVSQGDVLGLCGNSGNTSEPHLHIHLQTTPDLLDGEGLPAQFQSYTADGEPVERGEPMRGEIVAPQ